MALTFRKTTLAHAAAFHAMMADERVSVPAGYPTPKRLSETRRRLSRTVAQWRRREPELMGYSLFHGGDFVGGATLRWPHAGVAQLGCSVRPELWGRGYATRAACALVQLAFERHGAHRVQATCWVRNRASMRVLEKAGLRREGRLRGYLKRDGVLRDEYMYGLCRGDWEARR